MDWRRQPSTTPPDTLRLWTIGLWMRLAFAGVLAVGAGIALLFDAPRGVLPGLFFAAGGAWMAWLGWRGAREALREEDEASRRGRAYPAAVVSPSRHPG